MGMAALEETDVFGIHAIRIGGMIVRNRHALEGSQAGGRENLRLRAMHRNQMIIRAGQPQLGGQVFLHTGAGYGNVQADQVPLRLPAGDVFGEAGAEIDQVHHLVSGRSKS